MIVIKNDDQHYYHLISKFAKFNFFCAQISSDQIEILKSSELMRWADNGYQDLSIKRSIMTWKHTPEERKSKSYDRGTYLWLCDFLS